jgi:hypothetical protein
MKIKVVCTGNKNKTSSSASNETKNRTIAISENTGPNHQHFRVYYKWICLHGKEKPFTQ